MEFKVNKNDIIEAIANDTGMTKADATRMLNSYIEFVTKSLKKGKKVMIVGFGTFSVSKRSARKGRNPRTGEVIQIKGSNQPKFTAGKALKEAVN